MNNEKIKLASKIVLTVIGVTVIIIGLCALFGSVDTGPIATMWDNVSDDTKLICIAIVFAGFLAN